MDQDAPSARAGQDRSTLMSRHIEARARRDAAPLDSPAYRQASEEVASIEIAIAAAEEPPAVVGGVAQPAEVKPLRSR